MTGRHPRALLLCLIVCGAIGRSADAGSPGAGQFRDGVARLAARNKGFGAVIARVGDSSGAELTAADGNLAGPGSPAADDDTPFEIASVTKAVTAAAALRLCEQGLLGLDWPLSRILPESAARGLDPTITLRQLLNHTSGLPDYWTDGPLDADGHNAFLREFLATPERRWSPGEILAHARALPARKPGGCFHYSDTNYVLAGLAIERACGRPLHEVLRREIFQPLGMRSTVMSHYGPGPRVKIAHRFEGREDLTGVPRQSADWAGGGLVSTTEDLDRFLRGLFEGGLFRSPSTLAEMRVTVPTGEPGISYGLGLFRVDLCGGRGELIGHDGHGNAFAYYWPGHRTTITGTLNQTENDWWPLAELATGTGGPVRAIETPAGTLEVSLLAQWDSLYVYRGVNVLREGAYGSGIQTTTVAMALPDLAPVSPYAEVSQAFSTGSVDYNETSVTAGGAFELAWMEWGLAYNGSFGSYSGFFQSHELRGSLAGGFDVLGAWTEPSVEGVLGLGPETVDGGGGGKPGCGFLSLRLDAAREIPGWPLGLGAWVEGAFNFGYNSKEIADNGLEAFTGPNHFEAGLALSWEPRPGIAVTIYGAWSRELANLPLTRPDTFYGGVSAGVSF